MRSTNLNAGYTPTTIVQTLFNSVIRNRRTCWREPDKKSPRAFSLVDTPECPKDIERFWRGRLVLDLKQNVEAMECQ